MKIDNSIIEEGLKYGLNIVRQAPMYIDFSMELIDYMGEKVCPYCSLIYGMIFYSNPEILKRLEIVPDSKEVLLKYSNESLLNLYAEFKAKQEEERKQREIKENIDELLHLIKEFRSKSEFSRMLKFIGLNKHLAPYNAMLVEKQKPGCTFVFNAKTWKEKYNMQPKPNAQNLIVLKPFGPVQCMYDLSDTEHIEGTGPAVTEVELMEEWDNRFAKPEGCVDDKEFNNLMVNLNQYGICLDDNFNAGNTYCGYIRDYRNRKLNVIIDTTSDIAHHCRFIISVNKNENKASKFVTICHELGHLFCRHLYYDVKKTRSLSVKEKEFEAETVAWLVCKRHGISNPSEEYLAGYIENDEVLPISLDCIMKAVAEIESMLQGFVNIKHTLWYKDDMEYKRCVDEFLRVRKEKQKKYTEGNLFYNL